MNQLCDVRFSTSQGMMVSMKFPCLKSNEQFILTCITLVMASLLALFLYEMNKNLSKVENLSEAVIRVRNHAKFYNELKTKEPCLAHPDGVVNVNGQTLDQWHVCFPINDWSAASYQVYSNGRVCRAHCEVDMFLAAQKLGFSKEGFLINWPASVREKMKMVEEARKQGSKCTYY